MKTSSSRDDSKKACVSVHDEVYIKKMLQLLGTQFFGKATKDSFRLGKTIIGKTIICLCVRYVTYVVEMRYTNSSVNT